MCVYTPATCTGHGVYTMDLAHEVCMCACVCLPRHKHGACHTEMHMHVALHRATLSVGAGAHAWMCVHRHHLLARTLWSMNVHIYPLHKILHRHVEGIHIHTRLFLYRVCTHMGRVHCGNVCTWHIHEYSMCKTVGSHWTHMEHTGCCILYHIHVLGIHMYVVNKPEYVVHHVMYVVMCTKHTHVDTNMQKHSYVHWWLSTDTLTCAHKPSCAYPMDICLHESMCTLDTVYDSHTHPVQIDSESTSCPPSG